MQSVIHESPFATNFDQFRVLHDLQMMRNRDKLCIKKLRDVANREFSVTQRINNSQAMWVAQRLQSLCTKVRLEWILSHRIVTVLRNNSRDLLATAKN